ncbi:transposase [Profundibacter sp.]|uniref:transposase n=1 Tax=Profundibacter sp. TaxID=3101071 RepID=UPI003D0D46E8
MGHMGFFDLSSRYAGLDKSGDPLVLLNDMVPFEDYRDELKAIWRTPPEQRKSNAGRPPWDEVLIFKTMVLQQLYNLSDDQIEYQIRDRLSFMRFLGLGIEDSVPDAKTIWAYRERLAGAGKMKELFDKFDAFLREKGYLAMGGQIVDASIVPAPRQHNKRDENEKIKAGETPEEWEEKPHKKRQKDVDARGLKRPEFVIVDGAPGLEVALIALWGEDLPIQRCTVHKHRNLLAKAPKRMHDELTEDYRDMIYAKTPEEIATRRKAFLRKWRLKCKAVADSLEEAGDKLFTFTRLPQGQWKSARTTNAIERLNEEFRRRIKTQTVLPCAETVPMLLWALMASGQIVMRKVDGWETLAQPVADATLDQAA